LQIAASTQRTPHQPQEQKPFTERIGLRNGRRDILQMFSSSQDFSSCFRCYTSAAAINGGYKARFDR